MFHDRRRSSIELKLTKKQSEYFDNVKKLNVDASNHSDFLMELDSMRKQYNDRAINNLEAKARQSIIAANPDPCQVCLGAGCGYCIGTGRRLEGT